MLKTKTIVHIPTNEYAVWNNGYMYTCAIPELLAPTASMEGLKTVDQMFWEQQANKSDEPIKWEDYKIIDVAVERC